MGAAESRGDGGALSGGDRSAVRAVDELDLVSDAPAAAVAVYRSTLWACLAANRARDKSAAAAGASLESQLRASLQSNLSELYSKAHAKSHPVVEALRRLRHGELKVESLGPMPRAMRANLWLLLLGGRPLTVAQVAAPGDYLHCAIASLKRFEDVGSASGHGSGVGGVRDGVNAGKGTSHAPAAPVNEAHEAERARAFVGGGGGDDRVDSKGDTEGRGSGDAGNYGGDNGGSGSNMAKGVAATQVGADSCSGASTICGAGDAGRSACGDDRDRLRMFARCINLDVVRTYNRTECLHTATMTACDGAGFHGADPRGPLTRLLHAVLIKRPELEFTSGTSFIAARLLMILASANRAAHVHPEAVFTSDRWDGTICGARELSDADLRLGDLEAVPSRGRHGSPQEPVVTVGVEASAFHILIRLLRRHPLASHFDPRVRLSPGWRVFSDQLANDMTKLLKQHMPALASHFEHHAVHPFMYVLTWVIPLFARTLPLDTLARVWDAMLLDTDSYRFTLHVALALLRLVQDDLLRADGIADIMACLRGLEAEYPPPADFAGPAQPSAETLFGSMAALGQVKLPYRSLDEAAALEAASAGAGAGSGSEVGAGAGAGADGASFAAGAAGAGSDDAGLAVAATSEPATPDAHAQPGEPSQTEPDRL